MASIGGSTMLLDSHHEDIREELEELRALSVQLQRRIGDLESKLEYRGPAGTLAPDTRLHKGRCSPCSASTRTGVEDDLEIVDEPQVTSSGARTEKRRKKKGHLEDEGVRECELRMVRGLNGHVISGKRLVWAKRVVYGCFNHDPAFRSYIEASPNQWDFSVRDGHSGKRRALTSYDTVNDAIQGVAEPVIIAQQICTIDERSCPRNAVNTADGDVLALRVRDGMLLD
ncbi:hypothetical protein FOL47_006461 [Perkinsus chesapeaki]|uniref:Uncharacterized protein n=1 Tax=Perkinsus chesapeaki TaxID=330153 RepID=A0A7J6MXH7_PERCH|nr:hypothetical protein FOL47_006461 [Perkinsus chesapeaki]